MLKRFNLSEWALAHQALVLYFMIVLAAVGVGSYLRLGQAEDPDFTFKLMIVRTMWPGASALEVEHQLTGDGYSYAQLKENADRIRNQLLRVKDVAKVDLVGEQDEKIYVELANAKLATFGVAPSVVFAALQQQNAVTATG